MIKGHCTSNRDTFRDRAGDWPEQFVEVPRPGDYVRSSTGVNMKVIQITHYMTKRQRGDGIDWEPEPEIEVYLGI